MSRKPIPGADLAQVCWCDTHVRYVPPEVVVRGEGWSCGRECVRGCAPGAGAIKRGRPRREAA